MILEMHATVHEICSCKKVSQARKKCLSSQRSETIWHFNKSPLCAMANGMKGRFPFKDGYVHFNIYIFHNWLTLTFEMHFVKFHSEVDSCLLSRGKRKVCTPGDEAIMKIHKKLFSGIPINFMFFVISPKLQRIWSWNFWFATRKIWAFIWYQKMYYFWLSPGVWECDQHKVL